MRVLVRKVCIVRIVASRTPTWSMAKNTNPTSSHDLINITYQYTSYQQSYLYHPHSSTLSS